MAYYSSNTRRRPLHEAPPAHPAKIRTFWFGSGALCGVLTAVLINSISSSTPDIPQIAAPVATESQIATNLEDTTSAPPIIPPVPALTWPREVDLKVGKGDNLLDLITGQGVEFQKAYELIKLIKPKFDPRKLRLGTQIFLRLDHDDSRAEPEAAKLLAMKIIISNIEELTVEARTGGEGYDIRLERERTMPKVSLEGGEINSSLYVTAQSAGLSEEIISQIIRAYSYDVDFERDIKEGDHFEALFEKMMTKDGDTVGSGKLLYAQLTTRGKEMKIYPFKDSTGNIRFYNEKGISVIKQLLRTPLDIVRITSGFGMRRHPILGYSRMHRGVDFAASQGTPILAAGDGVISFAGRKGAYGNYISVKHNATFETAYGHTSRFARGIRTGSRVKQGQVIAYVGSSGLATGPHLHYEIRQKGAQVNPASVKFMGNDRLDGRQLAQFKQHIASIDRQAAALGGTGTAEEVAEAR